MTDPKEKRSPFPYHSIEMTTIVVGERFRKDYGDIDGLASSIEKNGLLQPLVIDDDHKLLAGGRRYQAIQKLGWTHVDCHYIYELDDIARRRIELEENVTRKDLDHIEQAKLTKEIERLLMLEAGITKEQLQQNSPQNRYIQEAISTRTIAEIRGVSAMTVVRDLRIANAIEIMPELENEKSQSNLLKKIDRMVEDIERALELRAREKEVQLLADYIKEGDSTSLILQLESNSVDCIITDPPYGAGNLDGNIYSYRQGKDYDDSPEATMALLRSISPQLRRVLKPDGHLWAFFGPGLWEPTLSIWKQSGFDISNIIAIWHKSGGATGTVNWDYDLAPDWEPFLLAHNRERRLSSKHGATFVYPPDLGSSRLHPNQKPLALIKELVILSTRPGDLVLDPFSGSGTTAVACKELGRRFIAYDIDPRNVQITKERLINTKSSVPLAEPAQPGISMPMAGPQTEPQTVRDVGVVPDADSSMRVPREGVE